MKNLREVIRTIILEKFDDDGVDDEFGHSRDGKPLHQSDKEEFEFPVWDADDHEYIIAAVYHRRSPFRMELWKATDVETGEEFDPEELEEMIPDLQDRAFDFVARKSRG